MFHTKLEVDRHVESCLKNINNETERTLKCIAFAKLYFKVGDYEQASRYVSTYLTVKPLSAEGLSLLGKSLEKQGKRETAIDAYRKSLDIDPKQNNLVLKAVTNQLGTLHQTKWFTAAYKMYRNEYGSDMSELRLNLIRGIEVVRCVGNHGLDVKLLVILANTFAERAKNLSKQSEIEFNEARAELYWKAALPLLEKLQKNQAVTYVGNCFFEYKSKEITPAEIVAHIEEGNLFNETQLMKKKEQTMAAPVNVVITSSDPLPKTSVQTTQVLSATIPPQHLKVNFPPKSQPHKYQIPLPTSSVPAFSTTPTVINQPPPVVSTQGLLSNIAPPIYSAIETKSPSRSAGLGLQIERSLSQSFNSSTVNDSRTDLTLNKSNLLAPVDEHDPCPDFKPIIPLPDEVPLNTGEEFEKVLFCERAKLFRFTNKEWRERGVGNIKILQNKEMGKVRILMRRDQVHKICANHFLTADMVLTPVSNNSRAYVWAAHDLADEAMVVEKLCVRFKTEEEASAFYVAFEKAKESLPDEDSSESSVTDGSSSQSTNTNPVKVSEAPAATLGGFIFTSTPTFKPKDWECKNCYFFNDGRAHLCIACETPRSNTSLKKSADADKAGAQFSFEIPNLTPTSEPLSPSVAEIETTPKQQFSETYSTNTVTISNEFLLGQSIPSVSTNSWGDAFKPKEGTWECTQCLVRNDAGKQYCVSCEHPRDSSVSKKETSKGVNLDTLVDVKTGEEKEEVLYCHRAKLFRFVQGEWKERGIGDIKILLKSDSGKLRVLMRREQVLKICLDHILPADIEYLPKDDKTWLFSVPDFSEGEINHWQFCLRFKTADIAQDFKTAVDQALQKTLVSGGTPITEQKHVSNLFGNPPTFGTSTTTTQNVFNTPFVRDTKTTTAVTENNPLFGSTAPLFGSGYCDSNLRFPSLAAITPYVRKFKGTAEEHSKAFAFLGSGTQVFASISKTHSGDEAEGSDAEAAVGTEEYSSHYEPIVPLPDAIVVSTGEEEEVPIFNERAKLFRLDNQNGEWKERGVGQMKILHHPVNGTCRFLLHCEQVHKVVLNMLITPTTELQPMTTSELQPMTTSELQPITTSDKAWLWCGHNHSDDEAALEKLHARFKNCDLAHRFHTAAQLAIAAVKAKTSQERRWTR